MLWAGIGARPTNAGMHEIRRLARIDRLAAASADRKPRSRPATRPGRARPLVDDERARLETVYGRMTKVLALTIPERETIIRALDDPPARLEELRAVLLREHAGRVRDGLA